MKFGLWIIFLILLTGTLTQDFDLSDALGDLVPPIPAKPKEQPKPQKQTDDFDLSDIFDDLDSRLRKRSPPVVVWKANLHTFQDDDAIAPPLDLLPLTSEPRDVS